MSNVTFQDEVNMSALDARPIRSAKSFDKIAKWLIANKLAKTPAQANYILIGVLAVAIITSMSLFFIGNRGPVGPTLQDIERAESTFRT